MRKYLFVALSIVAILMLVGSHRPKLTTAETPPHLQSVVEGNCEFALELYTHLRDTEGNLLLSPYNVSLALAIAYGGAQGATAEQMATTLRFDADQEKLHAGMEEIRETLIALARQKKMELIIAMGLWPQREYEFQEAFLKLAKEKYESEVSLVDFVGNPTGAAREINSWARRQTKDRIQGALPPNAVTRDTRLVILASTYFKGDWASQFDKQHTECKPFWITPKRSVPVSMMHQKHVFRYAKTENVRMIELPYLDDGFSMIVFLPHQ